jgi:nucleotide-binding universal stress UspA family protein
MLTNVIAGVDGHAGGRDAIALACRLAEHDEQVTLAHVYAGETHASRGSETGADASKREHAIELLTSALDQEHLDAGLRAVAAKSPARGLHLLAQALNADVLVVGASRRGLLGGVLLGDDTRAVLHGAPCAVAIAPVGYADDPASIRKIGVGYNGSAESEHAVAFGRRLAVQYGARLSALEAVALPSYVPVSMMVMSPGMIDELIAGANKDLSKLEGVEPHAAYGQAAVELERFSQCLDLLVLGSRDLGRFGRLVHGSTSQQLARSAHCPLLVVGGTTREAKRADAAEHQSNVAPPGART